MSSSHLIEQFDFDIEFNCRDVSLEDEFWLSELLQNVLLPIVDEVLDRYEQPGMVVRLDSLKLDLGAIPRADFERQICARMRTVLEDTLTRALPDERTDAASISAASSLFTHSFHEAELDQLALFLATGRLPWHVDITTILAHEMQLIRLIENESGALWATLAEALRHPDSARRLVTQYSEMLLLSIVQKRVPGQADALWRLIGQFRAQVRALRFPGFSEARVMQVCWQRVLVNCLTWPATALSVHELDLDIAAALGVVANPPTAATPVIPAPVHGAASGELDQLTLFLFHGQWPGHAIVGSPHVLALEHLLARAGEPLWRTLAHALTMPDSARRLLEQFPERQLAAILHLAAPDYADQLCALLVDLPRRARAAFGARAGGLRMTQLCWHRILAAALARPVLRLSFDVLENNISEEIESLAQVSLSEAVGLGRQVSPDQGLALAGAIEDARASVDTPDCLAQAAAGGGRLNELDQLARFLRSGQWQALEQGSVTHVQLLDRLLVQGNDHLWEVLADALTRPDSARRLIEQFLERQLLTILSLAAPQSGDQLCKLLDALRQRSRTAFGTHIHAARMVQLCWQKLLAAALVRPAIEMSPQALGDSIIAEFFGEGVDSQFATPPVIGDDKLGALALFLQSGYWFLRTDASDVFAGLLAYPGEPLWTVLAEALRHPESSYRLVEQFSETQLLDVLYGCVPSQANQLNGLLDELRQHARTTSLSSLGVRRTMQLCWQRVLAASLARPSRPFSAHVLRVGIMAELTLLAGGDMTPPLSNGSDRLHYTKISPLTTRSLRRANVVPLWRSSLPEQQSDRALMRMLKTFEQQGNCNLSSVNAPRVTAAKGEWMSARVRYALSGVDTGQRTLRQRQFLANLLSEQCTAIERLMPDTPPTTILLPGSRQTPFDPATVSPSANTDNVLYDARQIASLARQLHRGTSLTATMDLSQPDLRRLIVEYVHTDPSIGVSYRDDLLASIDSAAAKSGNPAWYWRHVMATLFRREPLDLEAIHAIGPDLQPANIHDEAAAAAAFASVPERADSAVAQPARIRSAIATALSSGDFGPLNDQWQALLRDHSPLLRQGIRHYARSPVVRATLSARLPDQMLGELVDLFEPSLTRLMCIALANPAPFKRLIDVDWKRMVWNAALEMCVWPEGAPTPDILAQRVLRHVGSADLVRQQELATALSDASTVSSNQRNEATSAPAIQNSENSKQGASLRQQVATALAENCADGSVSYRVFQREIDEHASLARNPEGFIRAVLSALHDKRNLDLEAMLVADASEPVHQRNVQSVPQAVVKKTPMDPRQYLTRRFTPEQNPTDAMALNNAGLVLAASYLPRLLDMFGLISCGRFVDIEAAERAVHLMQYIVTGQATTPEYQLTLNKVLCGLEPATPVIAGIDITAHEQETIEGMLTAMISAWKSIGSTSTEGLRQSFLARPGELQLRGESWQLQVEPGPFDMLLDRLPWGFSIIKFGWMDQPVHVTWGSS